MKGFCRKGNVFPDQYTPPFYQMETQFGSKGAADPSGSVRVYPKRLHHTLAAVE